MASAWESEFITPDDFQGGIDEADVPDIESVEVRSSTAGRNLTVTFARPPKSQRNQSPKPEVVVLNVAGPDREWVREATEAVTQTIAPGVPKSEQVFRWLLRGSIAVLLLGIALLVAGGPRGADSAGLTTAGWVVLLVGFALLVLSVLPESVLPRLEILTEGQQTRRSKALRWGQREVGFWARNLLLVLVGIGLTLLIQKLTD